MSRRGLINLLFWIVFSQLIFANELIDATSGAYHSLLLFKDGRIATVEHFERNIAEKFHFSYVESPIKFISIAAGENFNLAVSAEGSLWGWGHIPQFHMGKYQVEIVENPMLLDDSQKWESVFADGSTALALQEDGSLWDVRVLEDFREIQNPDGHAWTSIKIFGESWVGDYVLRMVLQDEKNKFWTLRNGSGLAVIDSLYEKNGDFDPWFDDWYELVPLDLASGVLEFQFTDLTGMYITNNDLVIFGLSLCTDRHIYSIRRMIESGRLEVIVDYLSTVIRREKLGKYKKVITGNFLNFTDFILDCLNPEKIDYFYSYAALLQDNGQLILWTNGKKFVSEKEKKIKKIYGGDNIFVQTEDEKIYGIGYFSYKRSENYAKGSDSILDFIPIEPAAGRL